MRRGAVMGGVVKIVGVCASGKSTLAENLRAAGYDARAIAQEHSYSPDMWRRRGKPDFLIFLDARLETVRRRLHKESFLPWMLQRQRERLAHARAHADLYLPTDDLTIGEVLERAVAALEASGIEKSRGEVRR